MMPEKISGTDSGNGLRLVTPLEVRVLEHVAYRESHPLYDDLLNQMAKGKNKSQKLAIMAQHFHEHYQRKFPPVVKE